MEGESQLDYVLLDGFQKPLDEFTICFWMSSEDTNNYGTPFSYATTTEDNEVSGDLSGPDLFLVQSYWALLAGSKIQQILLMERVRSRRCFMFQNKDISEVFGMRRAGH